MRSLTLLAGIAALANAQLLPLSDLEAMTAPPVKYAPQGVGAVSDAVSYDSKSTYDSTYSDFYSSLKGSSKIKRTIRTPFTKRTDIPCSQQAPGSGPTVDDPDSADTFLAYQPFHDTASSAATPDGWVSVFNDLSRTVKSTMGYLGSDSLDSYDSSVCTARCNDKDGCQSVNLFFERDPTLNPSEDCANPPSTTVIKCVYWGIKITVDDATNDGQYRNDFHVVQTGSNGYTRASAPELPGYDVTPLGDATINADTSCNSYITYKSWNDGSPFDPARCAAACEAESQYNIDHLCSRSICRFFNTYILVKNGVAQGQICALYTRSWDSSYATNYGEHSTDGADEYTRTSSYTYSNHTDPGANICNHDCMSQDPCPSCPASSSTTTPLATSWSTTYSSSSTTDAFTSTADTSSLTTTSDTSSSWTTTGAATTSTTDSITTTDSTR